MESMETWTIDDLKNLKGSISITGTEELNYVYTEGVTSVASIGITCPHCGKFIDIDNKEGV